MTPSAFAGRGLGFRVLLLLLVALSFVARPGSASAHAAFLRSDPAPNAVLATAPDRIQIWFFEPLEAAATGADLLDLSGAEIAGTTARVADDDDHRLDIVLPAGLTDGTYTVSWRNLSAADGHTTDGYFGFSVGAGGGAVAVPTANAGGPPAWQRTASRWAALLGLAAAVAAWPIWILVLRPAGAVAGPGISRRARRFAAGALIAAVVGNLAALLVQAAATVGSTRLGDGLPTTLFDTRYGRLWWLRIGLLLVLGIALAIAARWPHRRAVDHAVVAVSVALPLPFSLISHASAQATGRAVAVAADALHLLGASVWAGGLFVLAGVLLPEARRLPGDERRAILARSIPRFSAIALVAWAVLGFTGLYSAWLHAGTLDGLRDTAYGATLTRKLLLLAPLLVLGAVNVLVVSRGVGRHPTTPDPDVGQIWGRRFAAIVGAEVVLVTLVLLTVGRLTSQEPARAELAAALPTGLTANFSLASKDNLRAATLTLAPGAAGLNRFRLDVAGDPLPDRTDALLRVTPPGQTGARSEIDLARESVTANVFVYDGTDLALTGEWGIELIVRRIGAFTFAGTQPLVLSAAPPLPDPDALPDPAWSFNRGGLVGLGLLVAGVAMAVGTGTAGRRPSRWRGAGLGAATFALGALLLVQARIDPNAAEPAPEPLAVPAAQVPALGPTTVPTTPTMPPGHRILALGSPPPHGGMHPGVASPAPHDGMEMTGK